MGVTSTGASSGRVFSRVMHISRGLPLISAEQEPHFPALQFQRTARSGALSAWMRCTASSTTIPSTTSVSYSRKSPPLASPRQIRKRRVRFAAFASCAVCSAANESPLATVPGFTRSVVLIPSPGPVSAVVRSPAERRVLRTPLRTPRSFERRAVRELRVHAYVDRSVGAELAERDGGRGLVAVGVRAAPSRVPLHTVAADRQCHARQLLERAPDPHAQLRVVGGRG